MEPSPSNADLSNFSVASSNSSMENNRYDGAPCDPSAAACEMIPEVNKLILL